MTAAASDAMPGGLVAIVDDDDSVRLAMLSLIRSLGHRSVGFASADGFLHSPEIDSAACLITDIRMPGMSGIALQRALQAQGRRLPTIFMTGFPEPRVRDQLLAGGAICFLAKPFDAADLLRCLDAALRARD